MKHNIAVLILVALGFGLVGCGRQETTGTSQVIKIAVPVPMTGKYAEYGIDLINAAQMAVDEKNATGGVNGKTVVLVAEDDKGDPKDAVTVAYKIVGNKDIIGIMGNLNSGTTLAASSVYAEAGIPVIMPVPTNPKITQQGFNNLFRVPLTDDKQGGAAYEFLASKVSRNSISVIHNKETYGKGIAEEFVKAMKAEGCPPLLFEGVNAGDQDYRPVVGKLRASGAKGLFFGGGYAEAARLIRQAREQGFEGVIVMGDGCFNTDVAKIAGDAVRNCYIANISPVNAPDARALKFYDDYTARYGKIVAFAPLGYVSTWILMDAIEKSSELSRSSVVATLRSPDYSYDSILGVFTFKNNGDSEGRKIFWHQFNDGDLVAISDGK